jgi:hypothetical protein
MDPAEWRVQRSELWRRRNRVLNVLMVLAIAAVLARYLLSS